MQKTAISGEVSVKRDDDGKIESVVVSGDGKTLSFAVCKAVDRESGKKYSISANDILKLASFEGQTVRLNCTLWNGKPIDVGCISCLSKPQPGALNIK